MSERRRLLLAIANQFKWLPYSYTNLYYDLVPQTISGKTVRNKAKVSKIYGNSVVENQLVQNGNFENKSEWLLYLLNDTTWSVSDNIATIVVNSMANYSGQFYQYITPKTNHRYLLIVEIKSSANGTVNWRLGGDTSTTINTTTNWQKYALIGVRTDSSADFGLYLFNNLIATPITIYLRNVQYIDLTQMFPFDTPTTLTDKRVQNILNRGYIPYNTGEIKGTDIGEISTTKADTSSLGSITFKYQGSGVGTSHDTLERTDTEWVFTKNMNRYTFSGSENWAVGGQATGGMYRYYTIISDMLSGIAQSGLCDSLPTDTGSYNATTIPAIRFGQNNSAIYVYLTQDLTSADVQTYMTGKTIEYPLATPQVIRIPRKRMGIVDLGSLRWNGGIGGQWYSGETFDIPHAQGNVANIYCSKYSSFESYVLNNGTWLASDQTIMISVSLNRIAIMDKRGYADTTVFKNSLSGVYLFYETSTEVADILDTFPIEYGGTITTDSEVLPNVDFKLKCK